MTTQKKLEVLQNTLWDIIQSQDGRAPEYERNQVESLKAAIYALEKQIPCNTELETKEGYDTPVCSDCGGHIYLMRGKANYCPNCGQALDWSDTDEMPNNKSEE